MTLQTILQAARLRTLPLSVSGILVGSGIAYRQQHFSATIFFWALISTVLLQILSNFANDYGDGEKGTDNAHRLGPQRTVQSGKISLSQMRVLIRRTIILCCISIIILIFNSFKQSELIFALLFLGLGIAAIVSAIKYTIGKSAYGYRGWGDIFVFIFFGWVSVIGVYFLYTQQWNGWILLPASCIGGLSAAVLNLNNMRDWENDKASHKQTLVVKIGWEWAKYYHYYLVVLSMLSIMLYSIVFKQVTYQVMYLFAFIPLVAHLLRVRKITQAQQLDKELPQVAFSTFLLALLFFVGQIL